MKSLIRKLLREGLEEADRSFHWNDESYPTRVLQSTLKDMDPKHKIEIDKRIADIEGLEFSKEPPQRIGIWIYKTPNEVHHYPYKTIDKGNLLLGIINNNNMSTLYWKHKIEGSYDYEISYEDLMEFSKSEYYKGKERPITIKLLSDWRKSTKPKGQSPQVNLNKFKKIKLKNGVIIRYYEMANKFETIDGQLIRIDDIFDDLPDELQSRVIDLMESIELPIEVGDTILMGKFKNKVVVVKDIEWDKEKGDLSINGKPALKVRIIKQTEEK